MACAASRGHFDIVKWLRNCKHLPEYVDGSTETITGAARNGFLDIAIWLHENTSEGCSTYAMDGAAENNHLDVVQWLHHNRSEGYSIVWMDVSVLKAIWKLCSG
ncbi:Ankyrin repeat-containing domain [Phytophthora cactorum]|nr:Ankyrin repeat-containing domain [Phytophthora cactorum]